MKSDFTKKLWINNEDHPSGGR